MRRTMRIILAAASDLSLLAGVLFAALWARSHYRVDAYAALRGDYPPECRAEARTETNANA